MSNRTEANPATTTVTRRYRRGMRLRWWVFSALYVGVVAALAASAFSSPGEGFTWNREGVAMLLTLPALIPALPLVYVIGAAIWNVTNAGDGGPIWPVTLVYTLMFAAVAAANVWLLRELVKRRRLRQTPAASTAGFPT